MRLKKQSLMQTPAFVFIKGPVLNSYRKRNIRIMMNRKKQLKNEGRAYVCHTYYQVYVSILKELNLPESERGKATLLLSTMSTNFENMKERAESTGLFEQVLMYPERRDFPELEQYQKDRGNIVFNMLSRIKYTKKMAELNAPLLPVDMYKFRDIWVFCDADPIGYYLNQNRIPYHAAEDATNTIYFFDEAWSFNKGCFGLKTILSSKFNLILVHNGYGKYCIDMEVNDISILKRKCPKYVEVPLRKLEDGIRPEDKDLVVRAFVRDPEDLYRRIAECGSHTDKILILTEPLCDLTVRKQLFTDLCEEYSKEGQVFIKPHPRDELNYRKEFPEYPQFDGTIPMEILNYFPDLHFKKVVGIWTEMKELRFADEIVRLGAKFMDKYEDPSIHCDVK